MEGKVLILSKTKMAQGKTCVGGIDITNNRSVRLNPHELSVNCPYNIKEVWDITYNILSDRGEPHCYEDVTVVKRKLRETFNSNTDSLIQLIRDNTSVHLYKCSLLMTFGGMLKNTINGTCYIDKQMIPNHSTCFWICDRNIVRKDYNNKIRYNYNDGTLKWGFNIPFVGLEANPINIIPIGSLIRLSLAHWWTPQDSEDDLRCYLQLSGYFLNKL
jgi:hypothetical protein